MNEQQIMVQQQQLPALGEGGYLPMGEESKMIEKWANYISKSPYYQKMGGEAAIISIWLTARELGLPVMGALNGLIYYVQGQVQISARGMNMLIRKSGHSIKKKIHTDEICHLIGERNDKFGDKAESVFTIQHARKAGLIKPNGVWDKYPARMLFNRALSNLAKDLFADCIGSVYVEGELDDDIQVMEATTVSQPKAIDPEVEMFKKAFDLNNPASEGSKFIVFLAKQTGTTDIDDMIEQCSKDKDFEMQLQKFATIEV
jgi:hypothetical protein